MAPLKINYWHVILNIIPQRDSRLFAKKDIIFLCIITSISAWVYYPSLYYDFILLDDDWLIIDNPSIRNLSVEGIKHLFFHDKLDAFYYPLTYVSLAIDYHFFGLDPFWMKLHNLLLHLGSGVLVYFLAKNFSGHQWVAWLVTGLFLLHPIQAENVTWACLRRQVLVQFNFLLSLLLMLKFVDLPGEKKARWLYYLFGFITFSAAMLSKFVAAPLPLLVLLYAWLWKKNGNSKTMLLKNGALLLPFFLFAGLIYFMNHQARAQNFLIHELNYSWAEHALIFFNSFSFYAGKVFYPGCLHLFCPAPVPGKVMTLFFMAGGIAGALLIVAGFVHLLFNQRTFAFLIFSYILLIASSANTMLFVSDTVSTVADRYFYIASSVFFLYISMIAERLVGRGNILLLLTALVILLCIPLTKNQLAHWKNTNTIMERGMRCQPTKEFGYRLAVDHIKSERLDDAKRVFEKTKKLPDDIYFNNPFFIWIEFANMSIRLEDTVEARKFLLAALQRDMNCAEPIGTEVLDTLIKPEGVDYKDYINLRTRLTQEKNCSLKPHRF